MKHFFVVLLIAILSVGFEPAIARDFYIVKTYRVTGIWSGNELQAERIQLREDVGLSWRTLLPLRPAFTLGYAQASGDDSLNDGVDGAYRQTGLHNNKWRFFGVNRFRYYGELLRPELSNLNVITAAVGLRFLENSSVELLYHRYRQMRESASLRDARIGASGYCTNCLDLQGR